MTIQEQIHLQRHSIYENRFSKAFQSALRQNYYQMAKNLEEGLPIDEVSIEPIQKAYERLYSQIMRQEGRFIWNELVTPITGERVKDVFDSLAADLPPENLSEMPSFWNSLIKGFLSTYIIQRVGEVMNTTVKRVNEFIQKQRNNGLTNKEIARMLRADARARELRANTIARTEATTAMNKSWILALESSRLQWEKSWNAIRDDRTRDSHFKTDPSLWIPISENFIIGGFPMAYPGDTTQGSPASEIYNCRCFLRFRKIGQRFGFRPKR